MRYQWLVLTLLCVGCGSTTPARSAGTTPDDMGIPDCTGEWPRDWIMKEQQLSTTINETRARKGECGAEVFEPAPPIELDPTLTQICRCFVREQLLAGARALKGQEANGRLW